MNEEYIIVGLIGAIVVCVLVAGYCMTDHNGGTVEEIDEFGGVIYLNSDSDYTKSDRIYVDKESNVWIEDNFIIVENPRYIDGVVCINYDAITYIQINKVGL